MIIKVRIPGEPYKTTSSMIVDNPFHPDAIKKHAPKIISVDIESEESIKEALTKGAKLTDLFYAVNNIVW